MLLERQNLIFLSVMVILSINLAHPNILDQFKGIFKWQKYIFFKIAIFASNFS